MSWELLERFIDSDHFNNDPSLSVQYLSRYANHVGIQYVLCSKLRQFSYEEIEFFLPQLCHLVISVENESMALEEFIIDLCEESVNGALLTFWLFQTYLHDFAANPQSNLFKTCRRLYNKTQQIIFGGLESSRPEKIRENVLPVSVLASFVLTSAATPFLPKLAGPLAIAQARKPRSDGDMISDSPQTQLLARSHTVAGASTRKKSKAASPHNSTSGEALDPALQTRPKARRAVSTSKSRTPNSDSRSVSSSQKPLYFNLQSPDSRLSTSSLPDTRTPITTSTPPTPSSVGNFHRPNNLVDRRQSQYSRPLTVSTLFDSQKVRLLKSNYFRSETQFLRALEDISNRLVVVPKAARLSALRAELGLIAQDLPAEIDVPVICPATLPDGSPRRSKHHRIVRLSPAEATVLNSAERVPFLLMVEVLREDFDFDPRSEQNHQLLTNLISKEGAPQRRLFELTEAPVPELRKMSVENGNDSVFEPTSGDLGSPDLIQDFKIPGSSPTGTSMTEVNGHPRAMKSSFNSPSATSADSAASSSSTPKTPAFMDDRGSIANAHGKMTLPISSRQKNSNHQDISALATHMRTAAQMLSQLDSSSSKRPKDEVAAIKAKIIASMQNLDEQNFNSEDYRDMPTFETIMANADPTAIVGRQRGLDEQSDLDLTHNLGAGEARMENDQKTGGVPRRGDIDDPSAATFGEDWSAKRQRIKKSSPYGWMKNWDLLSVIVKTGADLRQEAFACQLIQACSNIWKDAGVPVWVKKMRILVTGESCGLIETITNGVSLHSIKRSLTLANMAAGQVPRGRMATLKDHFIKSFGEPGTKAYKTAQKAFVRSLAGYSMISYVFQLKDRHNGNILIDNHGHIIHIDFGFMLSNSPGSVGFEAAPFKLTQDYLEVLGGANSDEFVQYVSLCKRAFQALRKSADSLITFVDIMGKESKMPCYSVGVAQATSTLRQRFQLQMSQDEAEQFVETDLVGKSIGSYYTRL
ncbi:MAG: Phosphatidylinositol 4-kinase pik1alpha (PI4-kinase)(PtdIns-4-kinase) [Sclerophora amabilis]|nr:MAG: Phosphatidylinositol 4-kinase pik1alpha (PI4-kinase)(PtdIns-4-kinase) [Sclerophora amabilis]